MRHRVKGTGLGRKASHRLALMRALATSLFKHKRITTTQAKAKEARRYVENLITKARKGDTVASRRYIARFVHEKEAIKVLFDEIVPKIGDRPGGYTRIIKLGQRYGDASEMVIFELVDFNADAAAKSAKKAEAKKEKAAEVDQVQEAEVLEETPAEVKEEITKEEKAPEVDADEPVSEEVKAEDVQEAPKDQSDSEEEKKEDSK